MTTTLRIEHPVHAFEPWKAAFDADPVDRAGSGVRRYAVRRGVGDEASVVVVDLDFDSPDEARAMLQRLKALWSTPPAARALAGAPVTTITELVEERRV